MSAEKNEKSILEKSEYFRILSLLPQTHRSSLNPKITDMKIGGQRPDLKHCKGSRELIPTSEETLVGESIHDLKPQENGSMSPDVKILSEKRERSNSEPPVVSEVNVGSVSMHMGGEPTDIESTNMALCESGRACNETSQMPPSNIPNLTQFKNLDEVATALAEEDWRNKPRIRPSHDSNADSYDYCLVVRIPRRKRPGGSKTQLQNGSISGDWIVYDILQRLWSAGLLAREATPECGHPCDIPQTSSCCHRNSDSTLHSGTSIRLIKVRAPEERLEAAAESVGMVMRRKYAILS
jgi:hypothetical protein